MILEDICLRLWFFALSFLKCSKLCICLPGYLKNLLAKNYNLREYVDIGSRDIGIRVEKLMFTIILTMKNHFPK